MRRRQSPISRGSPKPFAAAFFPLCPAVRLPRGQKPFPGALGSAAAHLAHLQRPLSRVSVPQEQCAFPAPMQRITFVPSPEEIADVATPHLARAERAVASFGQGCEGEPLLQGPTLLAALKLIRTRVSRGTLRFNTNASRPEAWPTSRPRAWTACGSASTAPDRPIMRPTTGPGAIASPSSRLYSGRQKRGRPGRPELSHLSRGERSARRGRVFGGLIAKTRVDLVQLRNLNIDPEYYLDGIRFHDPQKPLGIRAMVTRLHRNFPDLRFGCFNPTWRG